MNRQPMRVAMLAGWLFADLLLVLFLISLSTLPAAPAAAPLPTPPPASSTTTTTTSTPPPAPKEPALDRTPIKFTIPVDLNRLGNESVAAALSRELDSQLQQRSLAGRRAGFVLVFAAGPQTSAGINTAEERARTVLGIVQARNSAFSGASGEGYWTGGSNSVDFSIFFFTT